MLRWSKTLSAVLAALLAAAALVVTSFASTLHAADWPQAGRTPQHTNFTPDSPAPPYKAVWHVDFKPEQIYAAQPVVKGNVVFVTTLNGHLYALDASTGERLWHFKAGEVIWGSAACGTRELGGNGLVFVASWEGVIYALDAKTGKEKWKLETEEPISASPCLVDSMIYIGTRRGNMLALTVDGRMKWKTPLSWNIFSTAAYNKGRIYVVTQDLLVHALNAKDGEKIWTSEKMYGLAYRDFYPLIHKGKVLVTVTPAEYVQGGWGRSFVWRVPKDVYDKTARAVKDGKLPAELMEDQKKGVGYFEKNPQLQFLYVFNESDGRQPYYAIPTYGAAGLYQTANPPAVCEDGTITMYCMFQGARTARFDVDRNRFVDILLEVGATNGDETDLCSVGGPRVFTKNYMRHGHGQTSGQFIHVETREMTNLRSCGRAPMKRVSVLPVKYTPEAFSTTTRLGSSGWGASGVSPAPIVGRRVFWIKHVSELIAYEGKGE